jgi:hypothetical protein
LPPATGRIAIQNGTQRQGLAASTKTILEGKGHTVDNIADAPQTYQRTVIVEYHGNQRLAQEIAQQLGVPLTSIASVADPNNPLDALVILGDDFQPQ